jgi:P-type Ca2+ transporter type 2C
MYESVRAGPGSEAVAWHAVPADQVVGLLKTDPATGLDANQAAQRLAQNGPNRLPEGKNKAR